MTNPTIQPIDQSLFDDEGAIFMGARRNPRGCRVALFGVPYDGTPHSALAPDLAQPQFVK